jgi:hypothetical protein
VLGVEKKEKLRMISTFSLLKWEKNVFTGILCGVELWMNIKDSA